MQFMILRGGPLEQGVVATVATIDDLVFLLSTSLLPEFMKKDRYKHFLPNLSKLCLASWQEAPRLPKSSRVASSKVASSRLFACRLVAAAPCLFACRLVASPQEHGVTLF